MPGLRIFSLNTKTMVVTDLGQPKRIDMDKDCIYRQCLNRKSFIRHLMRDGVIVRTAPEEKEMALSPLP